MIAILEFGNRVTYLSSVDIVADVRLETSFLLVQDGNQTDFATFFQSIRQRKFFLTRFAHLR